MFKVQVKVKEYNAGTMIHTWRDVRPSGGTAYEYPTKEAARLAALRSNDGSRSWDDYRVVDIANNREV
jgi:hypothetical protein